MPYSPLNPLYAHAAVITPTDGVDVVPQPLGLYINAAAGGTLAVITAGGETITLSMATGFNLLPLRVRRVNATGTANITSVVGLW